MFSELGIEVTHDWTTTDDLEPSERRSAEASRRAAADITGVVRSDIYVLMSGNESAGKGMYVELAEATGAPKVYIVGPLNHYSIFYITQRSPIV